MKSIRGVLVAAAVAVSFNAAAFAAADGLPRKTVIYEDSQLQSDQGVQKLYTQLRAAARSVCAQYQGRELQKRRMFARCYEVALNRAVAEVNQERLTELHQRARERAS